MFQLPNLPQPLSTLWYRTGACTDPANAEEISIHRTWHRVTQTQGTALLCEQRGDELIGSSPQENGLRILAGETSDTWWQCVLCVPAFMKRSPAQVRGGDSPPPPVLLRPPAPEQCPAPEPPVHRPVLLHAQEDHQNAEGLDTSPMRKGWDSWDFWARRREGLGETSLLSFST